MPGPVLVIDAAGRPLMPLAAAHARKLLDRGRAQRFPNPALTIIQLDHTVEEPVLRPVLAGVAVHSNTAELFFLAAGPRTTFPLLYVVLDRTTPQPQHQRHARTLSTDHLEPLVAVLDSLRRFLPLSHVVLLQPRNQILDSLRTWMQRVEIQELALEQAVPPPESLLSLYASLVEMVTEPRRAAQTLVALPRLRAPHGLKNSNIPPIIGVVDSLGLVGILDQTPTANQDGFALRVAVSAHRDGIAWQNLDLPSDTIIQEWSGRGPAIIPVVHSIK